VNVPRTSAPAHSLTRRVILTICLAFGLVWLELITFEIWKTRSRESDYNPGLVMFTTALRDTLTDVDDPQLAGSYAQAIDRMVRNQNRQDHIDVARLIQIRDRQDGRVVFRSPADLQLDRLQPGYSNRIVAGRLYHLDCERDGRWEITYGQESIPTPWLLKELATNLTKTMLMAFPLVLLPVWLAVWLGLRPLRQIANSISKRNPDDLSPVKITRQHAELNLLADAFNVQLAKVAQLIARERAFVQEAAHELRTPMAVVAVNAYAVANAPTADERAAAEARLHAGLSRTSHLVEQLLALTRLDVNRPNEMALRDVVPVVRDELAAVAPAAVAKGIDLALDAPARLNEPVELHALRSIVGNLADNAIRYGNPGGRIVVTLTSTGEGWTLSVADDGPGIPAADRGRVFERFYRGDHNEMQGTGLGLAIVRAAATRLRGTVHITDGLDGRGCTFCVQFSKTAIADEPFVGSAWPTQPIPPQTLQG
jgi:two-component system sensor histidine kinase QseC